MQKPSVICRRLCHLELVAGMVPVSFSGKYSVCSECAFESHRFRGRVGAGKGDLDVEMLVDNLVHDFLEMPLRLDIVLLNFLLGKSRGMLEGFQGFKLRFVFLVPLVPGSGKIRQPAR